MTHKFKFKMKFWLLGHDGLAMWDENKEEVRNALERKIRHKYDVSIGKYVISLK